MAHFEAQALTRPETFNFATDVIDYWASKSPGLRAMYWTSRATGECRTLDYNHFSRESHRVATLLRQLGMKAGDRLIIILPRVTAWWEVAIAAIRAGVVLCPCTTLLVDKEIEYRAQRSGATAFIGDETSVGKLLNVRHQCPQLKTILQVGRNAPEGVVSYFDALGKIEQHVQFSREPNKATDPALIYFTSGTSGPPKMVLHNQISYPLGKKLEPGKVYWNLAEQGWAKAGWAVFATWNCGAALFVEDDRRPFDPIHLLDTLHKYPITTLCAPPTAYRQLVLQASLAHFRKNPPAALEHCVGAGEPLNGEVIRLWKEMSGIQICDGYGQTETILVCGNLEGNAIKVGSMGKPVPGVPMLVVDESGQEVPSGREGNIALSIGDDTNSSFFGIFEGYIKEDGSVQRPVTASTAGKTLFLTGDRATRDSDGYFWFVGRSDDIINSSGYRIGPYEVESVLKQHPGVVESAVVASPDPERVEVVKAFIVLTEEYKQRNKDELRKEIQDFCKKMSAPYKYPRRVQFVEPSFLPKTISGKIMRNRLRAMEKEKVGSGVARSKI
ncbi:hypothetical protein DTO164E3_1298 [Paecilomyces variotii]|nr:hypothetical protein DTO032I3_5868 [Paecilomyces variotii]KAJ9205320.1 hypothetical protein DTO164E3_1298 [Paecilomyces variotii]KAJ9254882.1 hypothetical protein DTO207G8_3412 [Paecilomyces variotii]KAJ9280116.1 hypothetical protein DTO021D3_3033 [Paecilomyces variotii]KAJ9342491.1 hypothetical protein DTO027B6_5009 [Paecilomyces variotii]